MFTVMLMEGSLHTQQEYTNGPTNTLTTTPNGHSVLEPNKTKLSDVVGTKVGTLDSFRDPRDPVTGEVAFMMQVKLVGYIQLQASPIYGTVLN
jgi:hypothetical protein